MSCIVYSTSKSGIKYAYRSESYWDKEKKQPRCKRKLLGRVDENGNIVPTGKRGRRPKNATAPTVVAASASLEASQLAELKQSLTETKKQLIDARVENQKLMKENAYLKRTLDALSKHVHGMDDLIAKLPDQNN